MDGRDHRSVQEAAGDTPHGESNYRMERQQMNMAKPGREVTVMQIPDSLSRGRRMTFRDKVMDHIDVLRPGIVLDCSLIRHMDWRTGELLLDCLEEAMKRNGDVRLASVSVQAKSILEGHEMAALFEFFDTNTDAVSSFRGVSVATAPAIRPLELTERELGNAI